MGSVTRNFEIHLTPEELAQAFCDMVSIDQAKFLNVVGELAKSWPNGGWVAQANAIVTETTVLNDDGRHVVRTLVKCLGKEKS